MQIPKQLLVNDQIYTVKIAKKVETIRDGRPGLTVGVFCGETQTITISKDLSPAERLVTFFHELLHAIEWEYEIEIDHDLIDQLEGPLTQVVMDNFA